MRTFTVVSQPDKESFRFVAAPGSSFLEELEDQLYIHWELTRDCSSRPMKDLLEGFPLVFTYHGLEYASVYLDGDLIMVSDLP